MRAPVELGQARVLEDRLDQPDRDGNRSGCASRYAAMRVFTSRVSARPLVRGYAWPGITAAWRTPPASMMRTRSARSAASAGPSVGAVLVAHVWHERPHVADVVVAVEDVEVVNGRHVRTLEPVTGVASRKVSARIVDTPEWQALAEHAATMAHVHLRELFAADAQRGTTLP